MSSNTKEAKPKVQKKLSIYLSSQRVDLLTRESENRGITLTQCLYELIDTLEVDRCDLLALQSDIRELQGLVNDSLTTTKKLTATFTLALEGVDPSPPSVANTSTKEATSFARWLQEALGASSASTILALITPTVASGSSIRFATKSLQVGNQKPPIPATKLVLSKEEAGPWVHEQAQAKRSPMLALVGQRDAGSTWSLKLLAKGSDGKFTHEVNRFTHPSRESQEAS